MRGIVYTGDGVELTDELGIRDPGPKEWQSPRQGSATPISP